VGLAPRTASQARGHHCIPSPAQWSELIAAGCLDSSSAHTVVGVCELNIGGCVHCQLSTHHTHSHNTRTLTHTHPHTSSRHCIQTHGHTHTHTHTHTRQTTRKRKHASEQASSHALGRARARARESVQKVEDTMSTTTSPRGSPTHQHLHESMREPSLSLNPPNSHRKIKVFRCVSGFGLLELWLCMCHSAQSLCCSSACACGCDKCVM
jgi:hypothetical protein